MSQGHVAEAQTGMAEVSADPRFAKPRALCYVVGGQKCGTTWLNRYFLAHPEIHLSTGRELSYWSRRSGEASQKEAARLRKRLKRDPFYMRLTRPKRYRLLHLFQRMHEAEASDHTRYADLMFHGYRGEAVVADVSPAYASLGRSDFREIARLNDQVRFIFVMRDPVDRLHSAFRHYLRKRSGYEHVTEADVVAHLKRELAGEIELALPSSRYDLTIGELEAAVAKDQILYLFYETLFSAEKLTEICDFLGVGAVPGRTEEHVNEGWSTGKAIDAEFEALAMAKLLPVYDEIANRWGGDLPAGWRRPGRQTPEPLRGIA
ncbi:MAG: sulfotransferase [Pseudomonadota bacterium]